MKLIFALNDHDFEYLTDKELSDIKKNYFYPSLHSFFTKDLDPSQEEERLTILSRLIEDEMNLHIESHCIGGVHKTAMNYLPTKVDFSIPIVLLSFFKNLCKESPLFKKWKNRRVCTAEYVLFLQHLLIYGKVIHYVKQT